MPFLKTCVVATLTALLLNGCGAERPAKVTPTGGTASNGDATSDAARTKTAGISATALLARGEPNEFLILDTRSRDEFAQGHVPGAILIPFDQVAQRLAEIEAWKNQDVIVYCRSGRRAGIAEVALRNAGFAQLLHLEGDWLAWTAAGHPVEK